MEKHQFQGIDWNLFLEVYKLRDHILSTCVYLYYHKRAICLDLGFQLLLQFYHGRILHRIVDFQLNIKYATKFCSFFGSFKKFLINMFTILMMPAKLATPGLLKINIFWNKSYDVIIPDYDVASNILLSDSNYVADAVLSPKFGNSMREVIIRSFLFGFDQKKNAFFEGWSWFKFNNLGLALDMALKFYTSVEKRLKLKVRKCWGLSPTFVEVTGEKL